MVNFDMKGLSQIVRNVHNKVKNNLVKGILGLGIIGMGFYNTISEDRLVGNECRSLWSPYLF